MTTRSENRVPAPEPAFRSPKAKARVFASSAVSLGPAAAALGPHVVEHYVHFFEVEVAAYNQTVTDWERRRYFERI